MLRDILLFFVSQLVPFSLAIIPFQMNQEKRAGSIKRKAASHFWGGSPIWRQELVVQWILGFSLKMESTNPIESRYVFFFAVWLAEQVGMRTQFLKLVVSLLLRRWRSQPSAKLRERTYGSTKEGLVVRRYPGPILRPKQKCRNPTKAKRVDSSLLESEPCACRKNRTQFR